MRFYIYSLLGAILLLQSCSKFEFDPNQSVSLKSADRVNYTAIERIMSKKKGEKLTIAVTGDSHLDYDNLDKLVEHINQDPEIDFTVHTGDFTDHGLLKEYEWALSHMQKLNKPFLVTLGNHDVLSRGDEVYRHMFGNSDFSFVTDSIKFIFFNSNGREYGFKGNVPDINWLESEMKTGDDFNSIILVSHVPYFDRDFDLSLKSNYLRVMNNVNKSTPVLAAFNGHLHNAAIGIRPETPVTHYLPGSVNRKTYLKIHIYNGVLSYEEVIF